MNQSKALIKSGTWVAIFQLLSAIGQLAGIRAMTEFFTPAEFGRGMLAVGLVTLISSALTNPTMQAVLKYYPELRQHGKGSAIKQAARRQIFQLAKFVLPLAGIIGVVGYTRGWATPMELMLLVLLLAAETYRIQATALLSATGSQKSYGAWIAMEAWARPIITLALIGILSANALTIITGYWLGSILVSVVMHQLLPKDSKISEQEISNEVQRKFWKYTLPLLPLGAIGWITGMADRYIISVLLSPSEAGLYVAIFSIASRPMLMLGTVVELTLRPAYQEAISKSDSKVAQKLLKIWFVILLTLSVIAIAVSTIGNHEIAKLLLGAKFIESSKLMPWIVAGYTPLLLSHITTRMCYSHGDTRSVLLIEATGAVAAVGTSSLLISQYGLVGAATSLSIFYSIQLAVSIWRANRWSPAKQMLKHEVGR